MARMTQHQLNSINPKLWRYQVPGYSVMTREQMLLEIVRLSSSYHNAATEGNIKALVSLDEKNTLTKLITTIDALDSGRIKPILDARYYPDIIHERIDNLS